MASDTNYFPDGIPFEIELEILDQSSMPEIQTLSITNKSLKGYLLPILRKWSSNPDDVEEGKMPKLHQATMSSNKWLLKSLTDDGASINLQNTNGAMETALHHAMFHKEQDTAAFLLRHGAQLNTQDCYGCTALHAAVQFAPNNEKLIKLLLKFTPDLTVRDDINQWTVLHQAINGGHLNLVKMFLPEGLDTPPPLLQTIDAYHRTPLILAAQTNRVEIVKLLLERGASIHAVTGGEEERIKSALGWAKFYRHREMITLLESYQIAESVDLIV